MTDCIFCKIVEGKIPSYKVYEDDDVLAFLDINPVADGHTVVIPKKHYKNFYDLPEEEMNKIVSAAKKIAEKYKDKLGIDSINLLNNSGNDSGAEIDHFHLHIIPRRENDGLTMWAVGETEVSKVEEVFEKIDS